jgi:formylglycine-generating enzyme required for sulfatase activity
MKKLLTLFLILFLSGNLYSQQLGVKSFKKLDKDLDARVNEPFRDQNGDVCAIIKVVTVQKGFSFDSGQIGIVKTVDKPSEIWVYLPFGAKRITISHPLLGMIRDYLIPIPIEKATVYELVLVSGTVTTIVDESIDSQWLVIYPDPLDAMVYLNDQFVKSGMYQVKLKPGKYSYRVEAPMYQTEAGQVEIKNAKVELNAKLKPSFGSLSVTSEPEQDARVIIDDKLQAKTTPCQSEPLAAGEHTVQVVKDMYRPSVQKVIVSEGTVIPLNFTLIPNFAEITITSAADASIYINNQKKGTGSWQGRLSAAIYSIEAQKSGYTAAKKDIEVTAGDKLNIDLQPIPVFGSLDVMTIPAGASILLNGKAYGTTPATINKLLIGEYAVQISLPGYSTVSKTVTVNEGKSTELSETLMKGSLVTITSTPKGANLFVDNTEVGVTPYKGNLAFGHHTLRIEKNGKKEERAITLSGEGGKNAFHLSFTNFVNFPESVNGISFDMISIPGGTFTMGSINPEEKPKQTVTVSNFYLGKTEMTQALWQSVMGNNPSNFKGDNLPVEQVSWDDVQVFIEKISKLSGKAYRLPTEAEWEYAASFNPKITSTDPEAKFKWAGTNNADSLNFFAWQSGNAQNTTHPVGTKQPNSFGLYDMSGNVNEWCKDWYGTYSGETQTNPSGPLSGKERVCRGGGWNKGPDNCRGTKRNNINPGTQLNTIGFRLALDSNTGLGGEQNDTISNSQEATITSIPSGANLFIDAKMAGTTPYDASLALGAHIIQMELDGKKALKMINVSKSDSPNNVEVSFIRSFTETIKGIGFRMAEVHGGSLEAVKIDSNTDIKKLQDKILSDFYLSDTEVNQILWTTLMGNNPSNVKGYNLPVEQVNWKDVQEFIQKLNQMTGKAYRLPTSAEWQYAASVSGDPNADIRTKWAGTNIESELGKFAWFKDNSQNTTNPVGTKQPNALGLYDMTGNVWEMCVDSAVNIDNPSSGPSLFICGGGFSSGPDNLYVTNRSKYMPEDKLFNLGFRLALTSNIAGKRVKENESLLNKTINILNAKDLKPKDKEVTISAPVGVDIFIDNNSVGSSPYKGRLAYGKHTLRIEQAGEKVEKEINIAPSDTENIYQLIFGPQGFTETVEGVGIDMVVIKGGTFEMGQPEPNILKEGATKDEQPVHSVNLSDFYMGKTEVTVAQFKAFIAATGYKTDAEKGGTSAFFTGNEWKKSEGVNWRSDALGNVLPSSDYNHPVIFVSWNDAVAFCMWLSSKTGKSYRLPTEAEWEYAASTGVASKRTRWSGTDTDSNLENYAWYVNNSQSVTNAVGQKKPNHLGLYDMSGNVWEWCQDWYGARAYGSSQTVNPVGPDSGTYRVDRGGSWGDSPISLRAANRDFFMPQNRSNTLGFRLACSF